MRNLRKPQRTFKVWIGQTKQIIIRPAHRTAFAIAQEMFPDVQPGEHVEENTYRFHSPVWGWVYVSWKETEEGDYLHDNS